MASTDGARSWSDVASAPHLQRVEWRADGLRGISADGRLFHASSVDGEWPEIGRIDSETVAFSTRGDDWWIVTDEAIVMHAHGDLDFAEIYVPPDGSL